MLFYDLSCIKYLCIGALVVSLFVTVCAVQAYSVNSQRSDDDPEKKAFRPEALIFVFFTWPVLIPAVISLFLLRALLYGLFMVIFAVFLVILPRALPEPTWMETRIAKIGNALLEANSFLIRLLLRPWTNEPGTV
jgi:hypothetical protein